MPSSNLPATVLATRRLIPFRPEQIFGAFATPELLSKWWGPAGFANTFEVFEFQPNGRWVFVMHGPKGTNYPNESVFRDITANQRIVIEHVAKPWYQLTITLTETSNSGSSSETLLEWHQQFEDEDTARRLKPLCETANEQNLDRLTEVLMALANSSR